MSFVAVREKSFTLQKGGEGLETVALNGMKMSIKIRQNKRK